MAAALNFYFNCTQLLVQRLHCLKYRYGLIAAKDDIRVRQPGLPELPVSFTPLFSPFLLFFVYCVQSTLLLFIALSRFWVPSNDLLALQLGLSHSSIQRLYQI